MFNELKWYDEKGTYRAVTGGAFNFPQSDGTILKGDGTPSGGQFPTKGTIPIARQYTGTITTNGVKARFASMSAADFAKLKKGDYLYDGDVIRQIKDVLAPESFLVELEQAFPSDLNAADILHCERQFFKAIYARSTHASDAATALQEAPFAVGDNFLNGGAPIAYDATAGEISFTCNK